MYTLIVTDSDQKMFDSTLPIFFKWIDGCQLGPELRGGGVLAGLMLVEEVVAQISWVCSRGG